MKPIQNQNRQRSLLKVELTSIITMDHELVKLAEVIDWDALDEKFGTFFHEKGRPAISTRLMISLHYLKYINNLSDFTTLEKWLENPYWQFFSGMQFFEHKFPIDSSSMTKWRKRIEKAGAEELFLETIRAGLKLRVLTTADIATINVDTTVQEKNIRFPTDARLYHRALSNIVSMAKKTGIELRQTYTRVSKRLLRNQQKFAHSRKPLKAKACTKKLKTLLGRVIRDFERKAPILNDNAIKLLEIAKKVYTQTQKDKNKIYSIHEPETSCIAKGKVHKKYEFGSKVSIASTNNKTNFIVGALNFSGNPHDGKTLAPALEQLTRFGLNIETVFVDKGYRGHGIKEQKVHICSYEKKKQGVTLWKKVKRRAAIEPIIGHLKSDCRLDRNRLAKSEGDSVNLLLSCAAFNLRKMLARLKSLLMDFFALLIFTLLGINQEA